MIAKYGKKSVFLVRMDVHLELVSKLALTIKKLGIALLEIQKMKDFSLIQKCRYEFDTIMSKGPAALIGWLGFLSITVILFAALMIIFFRILPEGSEQVGFFEAIWMSLMRTLDPGTMGDDTGWGFRFTMLFVTLGGIFVISALIGVITTGLDEKLESLRKGRSKVIEKNHTIILGWSEEVFTIISELVEANANQNKSCIVIMGKHDKIEMEDKIREMVEDTKRTKIVCRQGNPNEMANLEIVSLETAKSIIVLSPPHSSDPDAEVIKTVLAITHDPLRRQKRYHIVAEIRDSKNLEAAHLVGKDEAEYILVSDLISRIVAQTCRQSGLSIVYTELLDYGGDEIYFQEEPGIRGKPFSEAVMAYENSAVIGLYPAKGEPMLNPPMDTIVNEGDQIIAISEDDDTVKLSGKTEFNIHETAIIPLSTTKPSAERTLVLGWNWRAFGVIRELDNYVLDGSEVIIVADIENGEEKIVAEFTDLKNTMVAFQRGAITDRKLLDSLSVLTYDHVIVLSYIETMELQQADAATLITLLHLRDIAEKAGKQIPIVSEMLDIRNRQLAEVTKADDFIVSDNLVSLMLSQIAENKMIKPVLDDIFDAEGSEIYLKPITDYLKVDASVNFYTVVASALRRNEIAIGYKIAALTGNAEHAHGVVVNPSKSEMITFNKNDKVIVIAED